MSKEQTSVCSQTCVCGVALGSSAALTSQCHYHPSSTSCKTKVALHCMQAHLLRINMGNIHFEQQKYPSAIKMYRMALDQVPLTSRSVRNRILRNIGVAFMKVGQYQV